MRVRMIAALATSVALAGAGVAALPLTAQGAEPAKAFDFNGDGFRDHVTGLPRGTVGGVTYAGYVSVVPGGKSGPSGAGAYRISQSSSGVPGTSEQYDAFGTEFDSADLNADGYADLVVSVPSEDEGAGRLVALWGSKSGLSGGTTVASTTGYAGYGGQGLKIVDVTGDGTADIVGANDGDEVDSLGYVKGPFTPSSTAAALTRIDAYLPHFTSINGFAAGDFNGDGRPDLAATFNGLENRGTTLLRGTPTGLEQATDWYDESYGSALVAGDIDKDGFTDLAYGVAGAGSQEDEEPPQYPVAPGNGGTVRVVYGSASGPAGAKPPEDITQETPGVPGTGTGASEEQDGFGSELATGDVDADGRADLAIGTPGEDIGTTADAGAVTVLFGRGGAQSFNQGSPGIAGSNEAKDRFAATVVLRDVSGDGRADLAAGIPGEDGGTGRVAVLPATADGVLTGDPSRNLTPAALGLPAQSVKLNFGANLGH